MTSRSRKTPAPQHPSARTLLCSQPRRCRSTRFHARPGTRLSLALLTAAAAITLAGCRHQQQTAYTPPPPTATRGTSKASGSAAHPRPAPYEPAPGFSFRFPPNDLHAELRAAPPGFFDSIDTRPILTESGTASWYAPASNGHHAADGTLYTGVEMTAAHMTLPLGSTVLVTNLDTGYKALVRITDRGPFYPGRVLDLSVAAAKVLGVYRTGVARVQLQAFPHPGADPIGRWAVQIGPFKQEPDALDLKQALRERFPAARVSEFPSPYSGFWVRVDPTAGGRPQAEQMIAWIGRPTREAIPYLVRID